MSVATLLFRRVPSLLAALLLLGCASNTLDRHAVTTRFVLTEHVVPSGSQPFLLVVDIRPERERRYRHEAFDTYFGDENLSDSLSNVLRAEMVGQLSVFPDGAARLEALGRTRLEILHFEFSHKPMVDDRARRLAGVPPAVQLLDGAIMTAAGGPHLVVMRIRVSMGARVCEADRLYKTGAARPEMTHQMKPYFADLIRDLLTACPRDA